GVCGMDDLAAVRLPAAANAGLGELLASRAAPVERHLRGVLDGPPLLQRYYHMMSYQLGWRDERLLDCAPRGGKRLRPALCVMACESVGGAPASAVPVAAAVELVHNFSLVHDDIIDGDQVRHHRPALWALWGAGHGVNVGDGLL